MSDRADPADGPRPHQHLQPERSPTGPTTIAPGPEFGVSASTFVEHTEVQVWQGQFPPPDAVEKYEAVLPGAFDRIVAMAERLLTPDAMLMVSLPGAVSIAMKDNTREKRHLALEISYAG